VCCGTADERIAREPDLIGPPMLPGVGIRICDEEGADVEAGGTGEIWFRHEPSQMIEYYREPEVTRETVVDGWVRTGDLGVLVDGELRFRGRLKNVIKRSGETIGGDEIERALLEHPGVRECAVAAVPDDIRTEEVGAVVVLGEEAIDARDLARYCSDRLADWKVPRYWVLRTAQLPRLANEKIDVQRVKALLADPSGRCDLTGR
jgi:crotonobetaine/carnitine-CoA ligase